jgi:hypothetical protein
VIGVKGGVSWGHIRFLVMADIGSALTAGYLEKRQVTKR